jgi:hypothetical protein
MENYEINHELSNYDYVEGTEFSGLMPQVMTKVDTIGSAETSVHYLGYEARGYDAMEVVDIEAIMEGESNNSTTTGGNETGGEESGTTGGNETGGEESGTTGGNETGGEESGTTGGNETGGEESGNTGN